MEGHLQYGWNWPFLPHVGLGHLLSNCDLRLGLHLFLMLTLAKHFQFQANNSFATKQLEGRKQNKERLTLALCCNGDSFDKLPLWVIGKYKNPRCFNKPVMLASSTILRPIIVVASTVSCCSALRMALTKQKKLTCCRPSNSLFLSGQRMSRLQPSRIATGTTKSTRQRALGRQHQLRRTSLTRTSLTS